MNKLKIKGARLLQPVADRIDEDFGSFSEFVNQMIEKHYTIKNDDSKVTIKRKRSAL